MVSPVTSPWSAKAARVVAGMVLTVPGAISVVACGERCTPWEGSAVAYWDRVIATGAAAAPAERQQRGSLGCWRVLCGAGCADD
jgi:hypothetical protein